MGLKHSVYNYLVDYNDKKIIYNTFSGAILILTKDKYEKFNNYNQYNNEDEDLIIWIKNGFLVNDDFDELELINYCRMMDTFSNKKTTYRILTTTACNARCFYCYEENVKVETMTRETADKVIDFIVSRTNKEQKKIVMSWFGGEPLVNYQIITYIMKKLKEKLPEVEIVSFITTNGSLFSKEIIKEAKEYWNLRSIQITLDGLEKTYNERKKYINLGNGFNKVLDNIGDLLDNNFGVNIRLNYDKNNYLEIQELIKYLANKYKAYSDLRCYAYPLFNTCANQASNYISNDAKTLNLVNETLYQYGFTKDLVLPRRRLNSCFATYKNSFVITPSGDLYKCAMAIKDSKQRIGNIFNQLEVSKALMAWQNPKIEKKCYTCKLLPICQGGCRASRILQLKMNDCTIHKLTIDKLVIDYIENKSRKEVGV